MAITLGHHPVDGGDPMRWECIYIILSCAFLGIWFTGRVRIYEFLSIKFRTD